MPTLAIIHDEKDRQQVIEWIKTCPLGTRVQLKKPVRTLPQNDRMHAMITDIVKQKKTINGQTFEVDGWKRIFMQALGVEMETYPTLDGQGFFGVYSTADAEKEVISNLIEFLFAWGAEQGVIWSDPQMQSYEDMVHR